MTQLEADLQTKFNMTIEEYNTTGSYTTKNNRHRIEMFNLNSLTYLIFEDFVEILEDVIGYFINETIKNNLFGKLYIENISHFVPGASRAICTNFVDGRLFADIQALAIAQGCGAIEISEVKKKNIFEDDDTDLYRHILYDDDYLLKQLSLRQANDQQKVVEEKIVKEKKYHQSHSKDDLYAQIKELKNNTHFTSAELQHIKQAELFRANRNNDSIGEMYPFGGRLETRASLIDDDCISESYQGSPYPTTSRSVGSRPRGKQMDLKAAELSERPFVCKMPGCNRAFKRFEHLKRHNKMHTGEKPFKCKYPGCQREFSRSDNLTAHYKTHNVAARGGSLSYETD